MPMIKPFFALTAVGLCVACGSKTPSVPTIAFTPTPFADGAAAGNPNGHCQVPVDAVPEDVSTPDHVVGTGTAASCTADAFVAAVAAGGVITFDCGPDPATITLTQTAKVFNQVNGVDTQKVVIDGGGKVTISGGNAVRILYQDTCDQSLVWSTSHCDNQEYPQLTVQNITLSAGNSTGQEQEGGGGGAILDRGGRLKVVNVRFENNVCDPLGSDLGGAGIRALSQYNNLPVYVIDCTFGGSSTTGNNCANGGGVSSIGVSWTITNSLFSYNAAVGTGANSGNGGNGGAIYNDGDTYTTTLCGDDLENNTANEGGEGIFYVSNDKSGHLYINDSTLKNNTGGSFDTAGFPGIYVLSADADKPVVSNSTIQ
jgi:hypothetical protein